MAAPCRLYTDTEKGSFNKKKVGGSEMALYRKRSGLKFVTLSYVLLLPQKK
jgi:hypothetical protein